MTDLSKLVKVKGLVWHKSHIASWNDDWHTVPTGYTIRCADEWGWKWQSPLGAFGHRNTPAAAQAAAQADYSASLMPALEPTELLADLIDHAQALIANLDEGDFISTTRIDALRATLAKLEAKA